MCVPNTTFQMINPTTQVALYALCLGHCADVLRASWNIYQGSINSSTNNTEWILFNQTMIYENIWFFGKEYFRYLEGR